MKKEDYVKECAGRNITYDGKYLSDVKDAFLSHMCGLVRVPSYRFKQPSFNFQKDYMKMYEVSPVAPLHDCKGHIQNLLDELPFILNEGEKIIYLAYGLSKSLRPGYSFFLERKTIIYWWVINQKHTI